MRTTTTTVAATVLAFAATCSAQVAPALPPTSPPNSESTVLLNPFEVQATAANSYTAMNSNSLTPFAVPLDRLPATADILDEAFLKDVDVKTVEAAIAAYDAGSNF